MNTPTGSPVLQYPGQQLHPDIWYTSRANATYMPLIWKILASGYVPEYLYESGKLDTSVPFQELQRRAHVNARAQAADTATGFSRRIREAAVADPKQAAGPSAKDNHQ